MAHSVEQLLFVGFNSRVAALVADTGTLVWTWRVPKPRTAAYITLLLRNSNQLIVSANGYMYCLEPASGRMLWQNEMAGHGTGVASLTVAGVAVPAIVSAAAEQAAATATAGA